MDIIQVALPLSHKEAFTLSRSHLSQIIVSGTLCVPLSTTGLVVHLDHLKYWEGFNLSSLFSNFG